MADPRQPSTPAASPAPLPAPAAPPAAARSLWRRFLKARGARTGLYLVIAFGAAAFLAPLLAHRLPFVWRDAATGDWSFPLLREFFAPSDSTEPLLERGINAIFLFIPLALLAWKLMERYASGLGRVQSRAVSVLFGILCAGGLWLAIGGMVAQGGGADWLYAEGAPVPEIDDILEVSAAAAAPALPGLRDILPDISVSGGERDDDTARRGLTARLQGLVEGPALATPADAAATGAATHGVTDENIDLGINRARLNRFILEAAWPGLLAPVRQFRSTFLAMAAVSLITLLGLTYIFLAGAWQFALTPRLAVLLLLAVLAAQPFRLPPRHDHTPYRQNMAAGKGWGLFPPIPYGPNEQGFGPLLPPVWYTDSPLLEENAVRSWTSLLAGLERATGTPAALAAEAVKTQVTDWRDAAETPSVRGAVVAALNDVISEGELYAPGDSGIGQGDAALSPYFSRIAALDATQKSRLNRLLLERALPGSLTPADANRWKKPTHNPGTHILGTDESGRDVLVRILHGARVSLSVGLVSVFLATVIGLVMGSVAAYYGGKVDLLISRFLEIMMCFPSFFLILAVIAVLDRRSIINIMLVIGLTSWTGVARLIRGEMLRQKKMDYVLASIALGASDTRTIFRHILPNAMAPVLVSVSFGITGAILTEAGLSFIGFGVTPPTPTWGQLLSETRDSPLANWWLALFPGAVLFVSVLAYNLVGEALRDALDPRTTV